MLARKGRKRLHVSLNVHMQTTDPSPMVGVRTTSQAASRALEKRGAGSAVAASAPSTHTCHSFIAVSSPQPYKKRNVVKSPSYSTPSVDSHTPLSKFQWHSPQTQGFFSLIFVCNHKRPQVAKAI
ncbi:hypothetical protein HJG60_012129 [Phyllostomus discolor]|uniref:Uncharacterized protein n=1 Tax=Phyllostomus discolor TaxID=89673 RepID=A0A833ZMC5_9CHIR|nr:hypothetical protein HJG60_012129 [Phyllostomus discolor]